MLSTCLLKIGISVALLPLTVVAGRPTITITDPSGVSYLGVRNTTNKQDMFLSIPYAKPPVGALRFRPPQPWTPANNSTLVNATVGRSVCVQIAPFGPWPTSEDCLHLNIWKPSDITLLLPVLVYIHGGGFTSGSALLFPGNQILDTASRLNKPVVYVALNYRLGIFGFPPGQQAEAAGALNLGLKDQRLALEWVKKNIALFGGDPNKAGHIQVMLFGESAGAMSVGYQMMYKHGNIGKLFRTALMQSGAPSSFPALPASYPPRQAMYHYIANAAGCLKNDFECVRSADVDILKQASYNVFEIPIQFQGYYQYPTAIGPTLSVNDPFLSQPPKLAIRHGKFAKIPFVCGTNLDEGTFFAANLSTTSEIISFLIAELPGLAFGITNATTVAQLLAYYPADPSAGSPYYTGSDRFGKATQYKRIASIIGDLMFDAPRRDLLQAATSLNIPTWSYQFAQTGLDFPEFGAGREFGVGHSSDLLFLFPFLPSGTPQRFIDLSAAIIDYWVTLAYKLDPGGAENLSRAAWPAYGHKANSLKLEAGRIAVISDNFRSNGIKFIQSNFLT